MKRQLLLPLVAVAALGALTACSSPTIDNNAIAGTWVLSSGQGPDGEISPDGNSLLDLDISPDGDAAGSGGCNRLHFNIDVKDNGEATLGPVTSTMMACEQPVMDNENAYTAALEQVSKVALEKQQLILSGDGTKLVYTPATN